MFWRRNKTKLEQAKDVLGIQQATITLEIPVSDVCLFLKDGTKRQFKLKGYIQFFNEESYDPVLGLGISIKGRKVLRGTTYQPFMCSAPIVDFSRFRTVSYFDENGHTHVVNTDMIVEVIQSRPIGSGEFETVTYNEIYELEKAPSPDKGKVYWNAKV